MRMLAAASSSSLRLESSVGILVRSLTARIAPDGMPPHPQGVRKQHSSCCWAARSLRRYYYYSTSPPTTTVSSCAPSSSSMSPWSLPSCNLEPFSSASSCRRRRRRLLTTARAFSSLSSSSSASSSVLVDLRSDTVTRPTSFMLAACLNAPLGDDVLGEDPTVLHLEEYVADMFGKESALYVPTGTMANLIALMAHCHTRGGEALIGANSHISWWEGGGAAGLAGIHTRQIMEHPDTAELPLDVIQDAYRDDSDDHCAPTQVVCVENTHNVLGGVALTATYMRSLRELLDSLHPTRPALHVDGARLFHAAAALNVSVRELVEPADSVSVCLSKGLGAPLGSVLVGSSKLIRRARRARKQCGGGMRQAGVVASMGLYALEHHVDRLIDDHRRAATLATALREHGFELPLRNGRVDTNLVFFALPTHSTVSRETFVHRLHNEFGIRVSGGYHTGGRLFRAVLHRDVDDDGLNRAIDAMVRVGARNVT